ncbi:MAG: PP2C family protein-serine/threonine phosphatase, partial [Flavobacteriales bacterium]
MANKADSIGGLNDKKVAVKKLAETYERMAELDSAIKYREVYHKIKDSIYSDKKQRELGRQEARFKWRKKLLREEKKQKREKIKREKETEKQALIIKVILAVLFLVIVGAYVLYNRFKLVGKKKKEVDETYQMLNEKNSKLNESIQYAKRIQQAILEQENKNLQHLDEYFVLFKPKSIVSGDFYWGHVGQNAEYRIKNEESGKGQETVYLTVADCTGHGVPGAFMSMLGITFLNDIFKE